MNHDINPKKTPSKVLVALSGGLDSALAATLLLEGGWDVTGLHFLLPAKEREQKKRYEAAQRITSFLGIPLIRTDRKDVFSRRVIQPFVAGYKEGTTPNPCVLCNEVLKFKELLLYAEQRGIPYIATGHYAAVKDAGEGFFSLWRGRDRQKDQSYFLHRLTQAQLAATVFPLGGLTKEKTRQLARGKGMPTPLEKESQEICFLSGRNYRSFLEEKHGVSNPKRGHIVTKNGEKVGEHRGLYRYTVGQRHGLGIASPRPFYVLALVPQRNEVIVGRKEDIFSSNLDVDGFRWTGKVVAPGSKCRVKGQVRYRHQAAPGTLEITASCKVRFRFDEPQWAVTPGQALVCYDGNRVVGGGWISHSPAMGFNP
jgi:tRNA-specific 2-thiouridylase